MATGLDATGFYSRDKLADPAVIARGQERLDFHLHYMDECDAREAEKELARGNAETIAPPLPEIGAVHGEVQDAMNNRG